MRNISHQLARHCRKNLFHRPRIRPPHGCSTTVPFPADVFPADVCRGNAAQRRCIADFSTYLRGLQIPLDILGPATDAPHVKHLQNALALSEETDAELKKMKYKRLWSIKSISILPQTRTLEPYLPQPIVLHAVGPPMHIRLVRNEGLTLYLDIREEAKNNWHECLLQQKKLLEEGMRLIPQTPAKNTIQEISSQGLLDFLDYRIKESEDQSFFSASAREVYCLPFYVSELPREDIVTLQLPDADAFEKSTKGLFFNSFVVEFSVAEHATDFHTYFRTAVEENTRFWEVQGLASWVLGKRKEEIGLLPAAGVRDLAMDYAFKQLSRGTYKRQLFTEFDLGQGR